MSIDNLSKICHTPVMKEVLTVSETPEGRSTELSWQSIGTTNVPCPITKIVQQEIRVESNDLVSERWFFCVPGTEFRAMALSTSDLIKQRFTSGYTVSCWPTSQELWSGRS
tara:strand:- start:140 stop:472 length:333 start_codon:yes stop_codon:yes gene_type:complete